MGFCGVKIGVREKGSVLPKAAAVFPADARYDNSVHDRAPGKEATLFLLFHFTNQIIRLSYSLVFRRGAGAVERGGLENHCRSNPTAGSNPALSASFYLTNSLSTTYKQFPALYIPLYQRLLSSNDPLESPVNRLTQPPGSPLIFSLFGMFSQLRLTYGEFEATP